MYVCMCVPCSVVLAIDFINIVVQGYSFGAMTNDRLQGVISIKVLEHDEEHKQVHDTYLVAAVCGCKRNTAWRSIRVIPLEEPCEDQVLGYDALALADAL